MLVLVRIAHFIIYNSKRCVPCPDETEDEDGDSNSLQVAAAAAASPSSLVNAKSELILRALTKHEPITERARGNK